MAIVTISTTSADSKLTAKSFGAVGKTPIEGGRDYMNELIHQHAGKQGRQYVQLQDKDRAAPISTHAATVYEGRDVPSRIIRVNLSLHTDVCRRAMYEERALGRRRP